jgi:Domain of unknown function (DUF4136)
MRLARLALVSAAVLSLACAGMGVQTDYDQQVDFAPLKSFAWLDPPLRADESGQGQDPFTHNTLVDKRVRDDVEAWLVGHGYRAAARDEEPDFLLRYEISLRESVGGSPVTVSGGFGGGGGSGGGFGGFGTGIGYSPSTPRQEGTLLIDVIDPETQQVQWRGWGTSSARDDQIAPERLQKMVTAILERFPPKRSGN